MLEQMGSTSMRTARRSTTAPAPALQCTRSRRGKAAISCLQATSTSRKLLDRVQRIVKAKDEKKREVKAKPLSSVAQQLIDTQSAEQLRPFLAEALGGRCTTTAEAATYQGVKD